MGEDEKREPARNAGEVIHDMDGKAIFTARIHGTGKVTIPKNVRDLLDLREGDYVSCIAIGKLTRRGPDEASL